MGWKGDSHCGTMSYSSLGIPPDRSGHQAQERPSEVTLTFRQCDATLFSDLRPGNSRNYKEVSAPRFPVNRMASANMYSLETGEVTRTCTHMHVSPQLGKQFMEETPLGVCTKYHK